MTEADNKNPNENRQVVKHAVFGGATDDRFAARRTAALNMFEQQGQKLIDEYLRTQTEDTTEKESDEENLERGE
jgi:hypothetical protein